jgi:lysine 2,3-aminomutase
MKQLDEMGEDVSEYETLWGYSLGETEERMPIYEYPGYDFTVTEYLSNFSMKETETSP